MKDRITTKHPELKSKIAIIHNWANADWIRPIAKQKNWFACEQELTENSLFCIQAILDVAMMWILFWELLSY